MAVAYGPHIHGEFSSADASALTEVNARIALYKGGSIKGDPIIVLGSSDRVYVSSLQIAAGASALTVFLFDGADNVVDPGESIVTVTLAPNTSIPIDWTQAPRKGARGAGGIPYPKVLTSAGGQVYVTLLGTIHTEP